jgi:hypothetical protein
MPLDESRRTAARLPNCSGCRHFDNSPQAIEAAWPALRTLGSGHASVRSDDGLCARHDRYVTATGTCGSYSALQGATSTRQS